jgi:hypothetical protein
MTRYRLNWKEYSGVFDTWEEAAKVAVDIKVGRWINAHEFVLDWPATIKAVHEVEK